MRTQSPRPSFLVPRVLRATGYGRPTRQSYPGVAGVLADLLKHGGRPDSTTVEAWWAALEPAIVVLTLAGYDCPEIAIGRWDEPNQYLRLLAYPGRVEGATADVVVGTGNWKPLLPIQLAQDGSDDGVVRFGLRVEARRFVEQPIGRSSPYPPLPLDGVAPDYAAGSVTPDAGEDPFADPLDGWVVGSQPMTTTAGPALATRGAGRDIRDAVASGLASALGADPGAPPGLVSRLDPATWEIPLAHALPVRSFSDVAGQIWTWLKQPANLEDTLQRKLDDHKASGEKLLKEASGKTNGIWRDPRDQLAARQRKFYPREQNLAMLLERLEREHWLVALFVLHEYGLIRLLPFPVRDPALFPAQEVVDDLPPTDVTGLYETRWGLLDEEEHFVDATMQINHAGEFLDGWLTDRELFRVDFKAELDRTTFKPSEGVSEPLLRFSGRFDHDADTWIEIFDVPHPDAGLVDLSITISFDDGVRQANYTMTRRDRLPRLSPALLVESLPDEVITALENDQDPVEVPDWAGRVNVLESLVTPLHTHHEAAFGSAWAILREDLNTIFQVLAGIGDIEDTDRRMRLTLTSADIIEGSELPDLIPPLLYRFRIETQMTHVSLLLEPGWTYWMWLNEVLLRLARDRRNEGAGIEELLDIEPGTVDPGDPADLKHRHNYSYQFSGPGLGVDVAFIEDVSAGAFAITCDMNHHEECAEPSSTRPHAWSENYLGAMFQGEVGAGPEGLVAVNTMVFSDPNDVVTVGEWSQDDFAPCSILSGSASIGLSDYFGFGAEVVPGSEEIFGDMGGLEQEYVAFVSGKGWAISTLTYNNGWGVKAGYGLGAGGAATLGGSIGFLVTRNSNNVSRPIAVRTFEGSFAADPTQTLDDFAVGDWTLTPDMRDQVAQNAARYLALLSSPEAILRLEGDASPTGDEPANELLSWRRALALYAWLRTLLTRAKQPELGTGSTLAATADRVEVIGNGEIVARAQGQVPDGVEDDRWRRVKIVINDQVIVFL